MAVGLSTAVLVIAFFVAWLVVSDLLLVGGDGTDDIQTEPRRWWQGHQSHLRGILLKAVPMSAIRIVVVVLQIVVQVRRILNSPKPICNPHVSEMW